MKSMSFIVAAAPLLTTRTFGSSLKGQQRMNEESFFRRILKKEDDIIITLTLSPSFAPSPFPTWQPSNGPSNGPSTGPSNHPSWPLSTLSPTSDGSPELIRDATQPPLSSTPIATTKEATTTAITSTTTPLALSPSYAPINDPSSSSPVAIIRTPSTIDAAKTTHKIALSPFRIDIVATASLQGTNNKQQPQQQQQQQQQRQRQLRDSTSNRHSHARHLQTVFQASQDILLSSIISYHLLMQYQRYAEEIALSSTQIVGVDLDLIDKTESVFDRLAVDKQPHVDNYETLTNQTNRSLRPEVSLVMVSYIFAGDVVLADSTYSLDAWDRVTLQAFTETDEKQSFLNILSSADDELLRSITDVDASAVLALNTINDIASDNETGPALTNTPNNNDNKILIPTLISLAFLSTLSFLGYITHTKYTEYQRNNANNTYLSYQQRKARMAVDTRYDPFESPPSSVTDNESPTSRDALSISAPLQEYDGMNRRMNMNMATNSDDSSSEDERGWSSTSTSTDILDWNVPYDELSVVKSQQPYDEQTTMELKMIQMGTQLKMDNCSRQNHKLDLVRPMTSLNQSRTDDDATLDGLYSTNDSYFDTATARCEKNRGRSESLDTLNCSVDVMAFGAGWGRETINFEGIGELQENDDHGENVKGSGVEDDSRRTSMSDVTKILLDNNVEKENDYNERTEDIVRIIIDNNLFSENDTIEERGSSPFQVDDTDKELYCCRISDHDKTTQSMEEEEHTTPSSPSNLKAIDITSKHASYKSIYHPELDPSTITKANISSGIFTHETLGMINRNRLKATPPPSENDYDEDVVKGATENTLLGWMVDTDSDEDSLLGTAGRSAMYSLERVS